VFIIGGAEIYSQSLPYIDRMYLTLVDIIANADVYFPELDMSTWQLVSEEEHPQDTRHAHSFKFTIYERKR
jgi:dihydrofolate reductase